MPSKSASQHRWVEWIRHNPAALHASGMSQAKADEWAKADTGSPWREHHDDGGGVGSVGSTPYTVSTNPLVQGQLSQYSSLPTEKLRELSARVGASPQGQIIQRVLQQREVMPQSDPGLQPPQPQASAPPQAGSFARGGTIKREFGGGFPLAPFFTRDEARGETAGGFLHGTTPGRADSVQTTAPGGAYVIPADVIAGLGEGNSLAGARVMDAILGSGPYGTPQARSNTRSTAPRPPPAFREEAKRGGPITVFPEKKMADGGGTNATPVALSHGEYVCGPEHVLRLGGGDLKKGHRILDKWVEEQRKLQIKKLKSLPGPVKN